jgi:hypothetical protein
MLFGPSTCSEHERPTHFDPTTAPPDRPCSYGTEDKDASVPRRAPVSDRRSEVIHQRTKIILPATRSTHASNPKVAALHWRIRDSDAPRRFAITQASATPSNNTPKKASTQGGT